MSTILITGASSGIGAALAKHYATPHATLMLLGRNTERLQAVARICKAKGATVEEHVLDVTDKAAMQALLEGRKIDLCIANAGISAGTGIHGETADQAQAIFDTNIGGVLNTIHPLLSTTCHIVIISSVAGMLPVASAPAYSASKACVRAYGLALRGSGLRVTTVCPGYIETAMTAPNRFPMPFMMSAEKAAGIIARGVAKNKAVIAFPWQMHLLVRFVQHLPLCLLNLAFNRLPKKATI